MIFQGPTLMAEINAEIVKKMGETGATSYLNYINKLHKII
jgi:hypothetical protein